MEKEYKDNKLLPNITEQFFKQDIIFRLKPASHYVECSPNTLKSMLKCGGIKGKCYNNLWLIKKSELDKYIGGL